MSALVKKIALVSCLLLLFSDAAFAAKDKKKKGGREKPAAGGGQSKKGGGTCDSNNVIKQKGLKEICTQKMLCAESTTKDVLEKSCTDTLNDPKKGSKEPGGACETRLNAVCPGGIGSGGGG